ncbi:MAG: hypothetical protein ACFFCZ_20535 [Promethearchaeota archaeon]
MFLIEYFFENVLREPIFMFDFWQIYLLFAFIVFTQLFLVCILYKGYENIRKVDIPSESLYDFFLALVGLTIIPLSSIFEYFCRIVTGNAYTIFEGNQTISYALGLMVFTLYYSQYARKVINLSEIVKLVYRIMYWVVLALGSIVVIFMSVHILAPPNILGDQFLNILFTVVSLVFAISIILTIIFSIIDIRRISNRLVRVRLSITTLSAITIMIQGILSGIYFSLTVNQPNASIVDPRQLLVAFTSVMLLFVMSVLSSILLYWGLFIPNKVQEWTGILPPSFKALREKQKMLSELKRKSGKPKEVYHLR